MNIGQAVFKSLENDYYDEGKRNYIGISQISYCPRKLYNQFVRKDKPEMTDSTLLKFLVGRATHDYIQSLLWKHRGEIDIKYRKAEMDVNIPVGQYVLKGHCDLTANVGGVETAVEFKTVSERRFGYVRNKPDTHYVHQVMLYAYGLGLEMCQLVYFSYETGRMKVYDFEVDKVVVSELLSIFESIMDSIKKEQVPDKKFGSPSESWECGYCAYADECWELSEIETVRKDEFISIDKNLETEFIKLKQDIDLMKIALDNVKCRLENGLDGAKAVGNKLTGIYINPTVAMGYDKRKLEKEVDTAILEKCQKISNRKGYYKWNIKN